MGKMKPQPQILTVWRIVLALAMVLPAFLNTLIFGRTGLIWAGTTAAWVVLFLVLYLAYLPLRYLRMSYSLTDDRIVLYGGVLYRNIKSIPIRNVQYTVVSRNLIARPFGLCTLLVVAAGGRMAIPGLRAEDAETLAGVLTDRR